MIAYTPLYQKKNKKMSDEPPMGTPFHYGEKGKKIYMEKEPITKDKTHYRLKDPNEGEDGYTDVYPNEPMRRKK